MPSAAAAFDDSYQRMNQRAKIDIRHSTCPHDCPSACALDIEVIDNSTIGRVRGSKLQTYTAGVVCAKVARYAERIHHPDRLMYPQFRVGPKGSGKFARISWDDALDEVAERFNRAEREFGSESVWPYYYAGTMGLVMKDGINRLTHVKKYSRFYATICSTIARVGFAAGTGKVAGVDPREMGVSDLVVIWGTNPVNTQVNVMTHAVPRPQGARRQDRGDRHLQQRHHEAGRHQDPAAARHRWRVRLRRDACAVPRRLCRSRLSRALHRLSRRTRGASGDPHAGMGFGDLGRAGGGDRGLCPRGRADQAHLLPPRLWIYPQPQWRGADARGAVHSGRDRRLAIRGRRRVLQQLCDLEIQRVRDRSP